MTDGTGTNAATAMEERLKGLFADTLGMRFVEVTPERVRAELDVREELCTVPGIMHGGAIMAFADTLGGVATSLNLTPGAGTTTIESKTNFLAAARTGQTIHGECVPLHRGKQTLVWQTRVTVEDRLVALVTQTQIVLAAKQTPQDVLAAFSPRSQSTNRRRCSRRWSAPAPASTAPGPRTSPTPACKRRCSPPPSAKRRTPARWNSGRRGAFHSRTTSGTPRPLGSTLVSCGKEVKPARTFRILANLDAHVRVPVSSPWPQWWVLTRDSQETKD